MEFVNSQNGTCEREKSEKFTENKIQSSIKNSTKLELPDSLSAEITK